MPSNQLELKQDIRPSYFIPIERSAIQYCLSETQKYICTYAVQLETSVITQSKLVSAIDRGVALYSTSYVHGLYSFEIKPEARARPFPNEKAVVSLDTELNP